MSKDSVIGFFEAARTDEVTTERLRAVAGDVEAFSRLASDLGRDRGFIFEPSDVREAFDALAAGPAGELSDAELSAVAGGRLRTQVGWALSLTDPSLPCWPYPSPVAGK